MSLSAQSRDVTVTQTITGADTFAPTVPANVSATGLSLSTIELNWDASTDNVGVAGYQVWRDGVAIATTTLLVYTDAGLASSTSYSYYLTAFDAAGNVSASSSVVIGTTLTPVERIERNVGSALTRGVTIVDLDTDVTPNSVSFTFATDRFVQSRVQWSDRFGVQGVAHSDTLLREHRFVIDGLQPETVYTFDLSVFIDPRFIADTEEVRVRTQALPDFTPPANVRNLTAVAQGDGVSLQWENPREIDFDRVRVVRSTLGFPLDLVDGWVVYEGSGTAFFDRVTTWPAYYTVFSIDRAGNVSSGAVVFASAPPASSGDSAASADVVADDTGSAIVPPTFTATTSKPVSWPLYIAQGDQVTLVRPDVAISLFPNQPFTVRIPAAAVPPQLTTIVAELTHPDPAQGSFAFLLRRSEPTAAYEATIDTLPVGGRYTLTVRWLDFATQETGVIQGVLQLSATPGVTPPDTPVWWWRILLILVVLAVVVRIIWRITHRHSV